ncbi:ADP-ribosylglycohydrolase family protein [Paenilisteria rocourtiae]|uniref:ADP-ribosylglycohydrolase n=1 Tax=Listeria rocourtiae TaxID=647910 RepID=A0A4R6ZQ05_9LIST|nr:ADP-ribosylglycohydrolase family protein [Listeria rocourtiae]MBC1604169.1 ADP-ribosylglycohydrolase family protein [Listeria rocourtiae]TDR54673.1 ADP-ribosylglycohydrolase [Listeria rocourtiae]
MQSNEPKNRWDEMFLRLNISKRLRPTLYGGIIGDAIGVPVEFMRRDTFFVNDMTGYGTYNQPPGTWSDDTSLTLCLIKNILENGTTKELMDKFVAYGESGYCTPYGKMFDIGNTTVESIMKYRRGVSPHECGGTSEMDNGNGAIMRISPLVFLLYTEPDFIKRVGVIKAYTEITHAHPRAIVGSIICIELLLGLYHDHSLQKSLQDIYQAFQENYRENHPYIREIVHFERIFSDDFFNIERSEILSGGYVVHTLEAAIWSFGNSSTFRDAIIKSVNLGADTDTVASITGSLAGMYFKMDEIPEGWLNQIAVKEEVDIIINAFDQCCSDIAVKNA